MLAPVEHGHEHIDMVEQVLEPAGCLEGEVHVGAFAPIREMRIELRCFDGNVIAERSEKLVDQSCASAAGQGRDRGCERNGRLRQLRTLIGFAGKRGPECSRHGDAQKR